MDLLLFLLFALFMLVEIYCLQRILNFPPHLAPLTVILFNTTVLYIFALAGSLLVGFYFTLAVCVILLILTFANKKNTRNQKLFSLPIISFVVLLIGAFVYTRGTLFYSWDEFSHWGVIFRYLMTVQELPKDLSTVIVSYPPFSALWQFFVAEIVGFKEENAYLAHIVIQFAAIIALFPINKRKDWKQYVLILIAAILSVIALNFQFQSLYADLLMGLLLAVGFAQIKIDGSFTYVNLILVILTSISLVLIKPTGVLLALIIAITGSINLIFNPDNNALTQNWIKKAIRHVVDYRVLLIIFLPIIVWLSWNQYTMDFTNNGMKFVLHQSNVSSAGIFPWYPADYRDNLAKQESQIRIDTLLYMEPTTTTIGFVDIVRSFTINAPYRTKIIAGNFINKFSTIGEYAISISIKIILVAIFGLIVLNFLLMPDYFQKRSKRYLIFNGFLTIGFIVYAIALYLAYVYMFYPSEALSVPSLPRYIGVYLLAWWLVNLVVYYEISIDESSELSMRLSILMPSIFIIAMVLAIPTHKFIHLPYSPDPDRFVVGKTYNIISQIDFQKTDKVYEVYTQKLNSASNWEFGYRHYIMRYFLTPVGSNIFGWSLGERDSITVDLTPTEWLALLNDQGYTYVLVWNSDSLFWKRYKQLFDNYSPDVAIPQLFKVSENGLEEIPLNY